jgi:L,D-peptidoglycan transpeptidase YkuD (ErfK/YbiS/YcfS/YnhG family)
MARPSPVHAAAVIGLVVLAAACTSPAKRPPAGTEAPARAYLAVPTTVDVPTTPAPTTSSLPVSTSAASTSTSTSSTAARAVGSSVSPVSAQAAVCPENLAQSLESTGSARQLITAVADGYDTTTASVAIWQRSGTCWSLVGGPWSGMIGENGFADHHIEGDGTTPTGMYGIGPIVYGNAANPGTLEPYHQLVCGDWWDEDPRSAGYNTFQHVPCGDTPSFGGGSEALWTETAQYPSFAVVEYNTDPVVPYAGSAIFIHADTGGPTTGCVSIPLDDLDRVLRWINPAEYPTIVMGPASEISRF